MLADFKISGIKNTDDNKQVIVFRFYEGAITTEEDNDIEVTRYRRSALLNELVVSRDSQLPEAEIESMGRVKLAEIPDHDPIEEQEVE
jgi:hypothetical protein